MTVKLQPIFQLCHQESTDSIFIKMATFVALVVRVLATTTTKVHQQSTAALQTSPVEDTQAT
jgi:hypothetical protein